MYIESWLRGQISTKDLNDVINSERAIVKSNNLEKTIHDFFTGTE